jgi:hypothetical protein
MPDIEAMASRSDSVHRVHPVTAAMPALRAENALSTFVLIGQNRQAAFQQAKADHDLVESELELKTNTELTRQIHRLTTQLHRRVILEGSS